jgi:hypothetical protein
MGRHSRDGPDGAIAVQMDRPRPGLVPGNVALASLGHGLTLARDLHCLRHGATESRRQRLLKGTPMTALLPPLPAFFSAWLRRSRKPAQPAQDALQDRALDRMLPMMLANAPHPYQASLLLYLMDEQRRQDRSPRD